jgi:mannosyl-oligosaccharide alpha-1,2-mannosidase
MRFAAAGVLLAGPCLASPVINNDPGYANGDRTSLEYGAEFTRAQAVKDAFRTAWDGYYKYAFPNDELKPQTNSFGNSRSAYCAVDSHGN